MTNKKIPKQQKLGNCRKLITKEGMWELGWGAGRHWDNGKGKRTFWFKNLVLE